jgi:putative ABC transport system ATP-binding protein
MIQAENLTKVYKMGEDEVRALNHASFTIEKGEMVAIMGPLVPVKAR